MSSWHPSVQKTKKRQDVQTPLTRKRQTISHENCHFLLDMTFLISDKKARFKFYMKKVVLLIHRLMPSMSRVGEVLTDFGAAGVNRCFGA
jgi:hypothetical protein